MSNKISLVENYFISFNHKEDKFPLLFIYLEFEKINFKKNNIYEYIYNNKKNIHQLLYNDEKNILVKNIKENILSSLFYITLLIKDNFKITNYVYDLNFIENINNYRKECNNKLRQFLLSIIIILLIKNYLITDSYNEKEEKDKIRKLINENEQIKKDYKNNKEINFNLNENDINLYNIDEIYIQIIITLIKEEKLEDYEFTKEILEAIELKTINITDKMFYKLLQIFNEDKDFIKKYIITNTKDLSDERRINFYYFIFYYIFKNCFYIYNIPFLLKIRNVFIKKIKYETDEILKLYINDDKIKERLEYITNFLCDSNYYLNIINKSIKENINNNKENENIEEDFNERQNDNNLKEIEKNLENNNSVCEIETTVKVNDVIKPIIDESICSYIDINKNSQFIQNSEKDYKEEENSIMKDSQIIKAQEIYDESKITVNNEKENLFNESINYFSEKKITDYNYDDDNFIEYIETIGKHKESAEFIKELNNSYFISSGADSKLILYNEDYKKIMEIKNKDWVTDVCEHITSDKSRKSKEEINLISCSKNELFLITINKENRESKINKCYIDNISSKVCLEIRKNNHLIFGNKGVYFVYDLLSRIINSKSYQIFNQICSGIIRLNDHLFALSSNKILSGGEDKLIIYNSNSQKIIKKFEGYSFVLKSNGLSLMPREETKTKNKTLLCACKKYDSNQKNGILLVNMQIDRFNQFNESFYDTGNFEVYCICPILKKGDNHGKILEIDYSILKDTDYFLAGGFDQNKSKGMIRLYKLVRNQNFKKTTIEYIKDIEIEKSKNFNGFKKPITCMIQSKKDGNLLVTSWDGNVYLFSCPKIETILNIEDEDINKDFLLFQNGKEKSEIKIEA